MEERKGEREVQNIEDRMNELVEFTAPYSADINDNTPIFVQVNGESLRIMRGETVTIKRKFLEAIRDSLAQERAAIQYQRVQQKALLNGPMTQM